MLSGGRYTHTKSRPYDSNAIKRIIELIKYILLSITLDHLLGKSVDKLEAANLQRWQKINYSKIP